ncbi:hypothetical protein O1L60_42270 [Streptomyces diastatochromogenes]|nr:hypothetical protein [Streptomyces diastatochromogenes]
MIAYGDVLREPSGRIHGAGTETATEYIGYFEGTLQPDIRVAREVLGVLEVLEVLEVPRVLEVLGVLEAG